MQFYGLQSLVISLKNSVVVTDVILALLAPAESESNVWSFPEGVANQVNKRVRMHEFVFKICKSRGKYLLIKINLYISFTKMSVFTFCDVPK